MKNAAIDRFIVSDASDVSDSAHANVKGIVLRDSRESESSKSIVCGCKRIILACPPQEVQRILTAHTELGAAFGPDFDRFQRETQYLPYISVIFHWRSALRVPKIWGYPRTSWGVGNIVLSDYMDFNDPRSKTVISAVVTMPDRPSEHLALSANEIGDKRSIMREVFRQLRQIYPDLPDPDYQFLTQSAYDENRRQWVPFNHAFMTTTHGHVPNRSVMYANLYNCGVQNGNSSYSFTSMESSVANAVHLATELQPELKDLAATTTRAPNTANVNVNVVKVREAMTVRSCVAVIAAVACIGVACMGVAAHPRRIK
jgi:hypothetical protein